MVQPPDDRRDSQPRKRPLPPVLVQPIKRIKRARAMRKEMSLPEVLLWCELKGKPMGMRFRKQFMAEGYYPDFACLEVRLLFEVDGIAHDMGDRPERDEVRDRKLTDAGWKIVRIPAKDILKDANAVAQSIVTYALSLKNPPRNGEVDAQRTEGARLAACAAPGGGVGPLHHPADGPPPRAGEDLA